MNDDFASGFLQFVESGTPTWPPIRIEGREQAQRESSEGAGDAAGEQRGHSRTGPLYLPLLEAFSETILGNRSKIVRVFGPVHFGTGVWSAHTRLTAQIGAKPAPEARPGDRERH